MGKQAKSKYIVGDQAWTKWAIAPVFSIGTRVEVIEKIRYNGQEARYRVTGVTNGPDRLGSGLASGWVCEGDLVDADPINA